MKWLFIYRRDLEVGYVFVNVFFHFFISSKYDFNVYDERMIVKPKEM